MAIGDFKNLCLFSSISGTITLNGQVIKNAKIKRVVDKAHSKGSKIDETTTDDQGRFAMPAIFDSSVVGKVLPMEFAVPQYIYVTYKGKEYEIWYGVKARSEENAESRGKPLNVSCELEKETEVIWVDGSVFHTKCTWDVIPDDRSDENEPLFDDS